VSRALLLGRSELDGNLEPSNLESGLLAALMTLAAARLYAVNRGPITYELARANGRQSAGMQAIWQPFSAAAIRP